MKSPHPSTYEAQMATLQGNPDRRPRTPNYVARKIGVGALLLLGAGVGIGGTVALVDAATPRVVDTVYTDIHSDATDAVDTAADQLAAANNIDRNSIGEVSAQGQSVDKELVMLNDGPVQPGNQIAVDLLVNKFGQASVQADPAASRDANK
jgi:hypothetical protein